MTTIDYLDCLQFKSTYLVNADGLLKGLCVDTCHGTVYMTHARNVWVGGQMMTIMNYHEMVPISFNYHNA